jgi:hypothetical protein
LPHTHGHESIGAQYCGGTIFFDAALGLIKVYHQSSLAATDTLISKRQFEQEALQCGISIESYHADNGIFTAIKWTDALKQASQGQTLSGVGGHHQNALAERAIGVVTNSARAMFLHLKIHWPDEYDSHLWPFTLSYVVWLYNHTPKANGAAPIEIFFSIKTSCEYLRWAKVFGCPVYVLDPRLQDGKKILKWELRSHRGQFLGFSPTHSSSVGLIWNIRTDAVSPQFHVIYDQKFDTVVGGIMEWRAQDITKDELQIL